MEKLSSRWGNSREGRYKEEISGEGEEMGGEGRSRRALGRKFCPNILYGRMAQGWHNGQVSGLALRRFCRIFPRRRENPPLLLSTEKDSRLTFFHESHLLASTCVAGHSIRANPRVTLDNGCIDA